MNASIVLIALLAPAQDYYEPLTKLKREAEVLRESRVQIQAQIDGALSSMRADPRGFYAAHSAECQKQGETQADGSFKYKYLPMGEWFARKRKLTEAITEKEEKLLAAYDQVIQRLADLEGRLTNRWQAWGDAVLRLRTVGKDLKAQEEEWRRTTAMAGWDFVNEFIPAMKEGMGEVGVRLMRPSAGSFWSKVPLETRSKLHHAIEMFEEASTDLNHAAKAAQEGYDASKAKTAEEQGKKSIKAGLELGELFGDVLKDTAIGATKAEREEFEQAQAAVKAFTSVVSAGSEFSAGGRFDEDKKAAISDAALSIAKFVGTFNPYAKAASLIYAPLAAAGETGIAASAWWTNYSALRTNEDNLAWAQRMTQAAREDFEVVSARLKALREERAVLVARQGH